MRACPRNVIHLSILALPGIYCSPAYFAAFDTHRSAQTPSQELYLGKYASLSLYLLQMERYTYNWCFNDVTFFGKSCLFIISRPIFSILKYLDRIFTARWLWFVTLLYVYIIWCVKLWKWFSQHRTSLKYILSSSLFSVQSQFNTTNLFLYFWRRERTHVQTELCEETKAFEKHASWIFCMMFF